MNHRYKTDRNILFLNQPAVLFTQQHQPLKSLADRKHHPSALRPLLNQPQRNVVRCAGSDDHIERCGLRPARIANER